MPESLSYWCARRNHKLIVILPVLLGMVYCENLAFGQIDDIPGWDLIWNDEFDGTTLNTLNWEALDRKDSFNNEKQYYHPDQVTVADGNLQLTAINVPLEGKDYRSGLITSQNLFGPGRFEASINLPTTQGMWPAFWLNANHIPWPQGGEIDIMENRGSQPNLVSSAYHWQTNPGPCCGQHQFVYNEYTANEGGQPVDFHDGFHTYTAEWDETTVRYYVDGNLHFTVTETPDRPIFETAKNIILNLAVGGNFGGDPDGSTVFPQTMLVDYVRYWQLDDTTPNPSNNLLSNPGFDDAGGSLNDWSTFGNTIDNVTANDQLINDGSHALKIYGQFNGSSNYSGISQGVAISEGDSLRAEASSISPSWDTLYSKSNDVTMKIEFYSVFGAAAGSSDFLGEVSQLIHDGSTSDDIWYEHTLEAIAPQNAVEARLSFIFQQPALDNGAIWIDSAGLYLDSIIDGDLNADGFVDASDAGIMFANWGPTSLGYFDGNLNGDDYIDAADAGVMFGNWTGDTAPIATMIPEPSSLLLASFAGLFWCSRQRR